MHECRICGNSLGNTVITAHETMFGRPEQFDYVDCAGCGCVQIAEIPADLSKHYPPGYYSQTPIVHDNAFISYLKRKRLQHWLGYTSVVGGLLAKKGVPPSFVEWAKEIALHFEDAILDVGSGSGDLLLRMEVAGFVNLTGVDPYAERDISYKNGVRIFKRLLSEIQGAFDLIMMHHSFEHMPDPVKRLNEARNILNADGYVLIRVPLAQTYAWKTYGVNWVQLDAPRHLYLHSERSMEILAKQAGFLVEKVVYDSTAFQFWGSVQCQKGIPLMNQNSYAVNPKKSIFSKKEIQLFEEEAIKLNKERNGDQAYFFLRRV